MYTALQMSVEQVLGAATLRKRAIRVADHEAENRALTYLARIMAEEPARLPAELTALALELLSAGSAGISIIEKMGNAEILRLRNVAGELRGFEGGAMPREDSPCGSCLARGIPQVYKNPAAFFESCQGLTPDVKEALVVPIIVREESLGTLWIVSHEASRHFDSEDVRLMKVLADFMGAALKIVSAKTEETLSAQAASNKMHVQQLRSSCRAALDNYMVQARATCDMAVSYPLSMDDLDELKERRDEEHNTYWKYMDVRQDLLSILVLDSEGTPDRFRD